MQKVTGIFYFFGRGETCPPSLQTLWQWADRLALQRCTQNAGKRFTFAVGQYRERRYGSCGNGKERPMLQRCT